MELLKKKAQTLFAIIAVLSILGFIIVITIGSIISKEIKFSNIINKIPGLFSGTLSSLNWSLYELSRGGYTYGTETIPYFGTNPNNPIAYFNIPQVAPIYGIEFEYMKKSTIGSYDLLKKIGFFFDLFATTTSGRIKTIQLQPK